MYNNFTIDELIESYTTMINYSGKAEDDILEEIEKRGGLETFLQEIEKKNVNKSESNRVLNEIIKLNKEGYALEEIKNKISTEIWTKEYLDAFIENSYIKHSLFLDDKSIDKELILKSIIGIALASIAGSGMLLLIVFLLKVFHFAFLIPIYFISYLIIKGYTGKTHNNGMVFLAGVISTIISGIVIYLILRN